MPRIVFGCPVAQRGWALPNWLACIDRQGLHDYEIVCVIGASTDNTEEVLATHPRVRYIYTDVPTRPAESLAEHRWSAGDYSVMAKLRNELREEALKLDFKYFFSLDSDIMLSPVTTNQLAAQLFRFKRPLDAISPLVNMAGPMGSPAFNYMHWVEGPFAQRAPFTDVPSATFVADVVMAAILMKREVLEAIPWRPHRQGEDISWSWDVKSNYYTLAVDPTIEAQHWMRPR